MAEQSGRLADGIGAAVGYDALHQQASGGLVGLPPAVGCDGTQDALTVAPQHLGCKRLHGADVLEEGRLVAQLRRRVHGKHQVQQVELPVLLPGKRGELVADPC